MFRSGIFEHLWHETCNKHHIFHAQFFVRGVVCIWSGYKQLTFQLPWRLHDILHDNKFTASTYVSEIKAYFGGCFDSEFSRCHFAWWRHPMETFSALLALGVGIHRSPVNSPHKDQWRGALMFSLICVWINSWVNNREAGDLRRYRAHYDVILLWQSHSRSRWPIITGCHS